MAQETRDFSENIEIANFQRRFKVDGIGICCDIR